MDSRYLCIRRHTYLMTSLGTVLFFLELPEWFSEIEIIPSVIIWSLGNESGCGRSHEKISQWARSYDSTRPLMYEGGGARTSCTDIICPMYARVESCLHMSALECKNRPVVLCELFSCNGK